VGETSPIWGSGELISDRRNLCGAKELLTLSEGSLDLGDGQPRSKGGHGASGTQVPEPVSPRSRIRAGR